MSSLCKFEPEGEQARCQNCSLPILLPPGYGAADIVRPCGKDIQREQCRYLGERTGRMHVVPYGPGIQKNHEHACGHPQQLDLCVPTFSADSSVAAVCATCDYYERPPPPQPPAPRMPSFGDRLRNYVMAVCWWALMGGRRRSRRAIARLLEICKECSHFADGVCRKCGCRCNSSRVPLANKLAMKTEHCPIGKW